MNNPSRQRKANSLSQLERNISEHAFMMVIKNNGLNASAMWDLKVNLSQKGAKCITAKNTIVRLACSAVQAEEVAASELLTGPNMFIFATEESVVDIAKSLSDIAKDGPISIAGGFAIGRTQGQLDHGKHRMLSEKDIALISTLPSLPELRSKIVGIFLYHQSNMVALLQAPHSNLIGLLQNYSEKRANS